MKKTKLSLFLLLIIPLFYFSMSSYFHENIGSYSLHTADPEYIYYICGVSIANGHMEVGNIDHPGTTLQYFLAGTFRIIHWIRGNNIPFTEDILANPDFYLKIANTVINFTIAMVIFILGYLSVLIVPNIWYAFIVQFTPFTTAIEYSNLGRITPETVMPVFLIILSVYVLSLIYDKNKPDSWKSILIFATLFAVTLALKLTLAFLLLIPLILIPTWKKKMYFVALTIVFFLIFAIPVTLQLDYFWNWILKILLYNGQYGGGEKNFVNMNDFFPNIHVLYSQNRTFFLFAFLFLISYFVWIFKHKKEINSQTSKVSIALGIIILLQVIMLGKQLKTTYFIPALMLLPLTIIMTLENIKGWIPEKISKFIPAVLVCLVITLFIREQKPIFHDLSQSFENDDFEKRKAYNFIKTIRENSIMIMAVGGYGGPSEEYALMTSYEWAGKDKSFLRPVFAKLYPDTYQYFTWDNTLKFWGKELYLKTINSSQKPVFMYLNSDEPELYNKTLEKFVFTKDSCTVIPTLLFKNDKTKETIYQLNFELKQHPAF
jgi:hypothetical protein